MPGRSGTQGNTARKKLTSD